jgi:hypothetical protein
MFGTLDLKNPSAARNSASWCAGLALFVAGECL